MCQQTMWRFWMRTTSITWIAAPLRHGGDILFIRLLRLWDLYNLLRLCRLNGGCYESKMIERLLYRDTQLCTVSQNIEKVEHLSFNVSKLRGSIDQSLDF